MAHKLADGVIARIAQVVQEGIILGVDVVDLLRQVEVEPVGDGEFVDLTRKYVAQVRANHEKLVSEALDLQSAAADSDRARFVIGD